MTSDSMAHLPTRARWNNPDHMKKVAGWTILVELIRMPISTQLWLSASILMLNDYLFQHLHFEQL